MSQHYESSEISSSHHTLPTLSTLSQHLRATTVGCRILESGYWIGILDTRILDRILELDTGYWILDTGYWILDTGYWILDAGCWILNAGMPGCRDTGCRRYWILEIWILKTLGAGDAGCWRFWLEMRAALS